MVCSFALIIVWSSPHLVVKCSYIVCYVYLYINLRAIGYIFCFDFSPVLQSDYTNYIMSSLIWMWKLKEFNCYSINLTNCCLYFAFESRKNYYQAVLYCWTKMVHPEQTKCIKIENCNKENLVQCYYYSSTELWLTNKKKTKSNPLSYRLIVVCQECGVY